MLTFALCAALAALLPALHGCDAPDQPQPESHVPVDAGPVESPETPVPATADGQIDAWLDRAADQLSTDAAQHDAALNEAPHDAAQNGEAEGEAAEAAPAPVEAGTWIPQADRVAIDMPAGTTFASAEGPFYDWQQLTRRPMLVGFFYTRDRDRSSKGRIATLFAETLGDLPDAGLAESVNLVLFTIEPHFDTPAAMARWANQYSLPWPSVAILEPPSDHLEALTAEFGQSMRRVDIETVSFEPTVFAVDARGRLAWKAPADEVNGTDAIIRVLARLQEESSRQQASHSNDGRF